MDELSLLRIARGKRKCTRLQPFPRAVSIEDSIPELAGDKDLLR
jgi:hypothetical protein